MPYAFFVDDKEITNNLDECLDAKKKFSTELVVDIVYQEQAVFKVRPITRCTRSVFERNLKCAYIPRYLLLYFCKSP